MQVLSRQRGISLIEVLMAVLIFSISLIGMAGLMMMATRSNQAAYLRTQVAFIAQNMADRMHANPVAVWKGDYNVSFPSTVTQTCNTTTSCNVDQLANHDIGVWNSQLSTFLPPPSTGPLASIVCNQASVGFTPSADQMAMNPPYGGNCVMTINWTERGTGDTTHSVATPQSFTWNFQP